MSLRGQLRVGVGVLALLLCQPGRADAEPTGAVLERVRAHYEAGRALFKIGRFDEALREFVTGYELSDRPQFLVNIGQVYRKLGDLPKAKEAFQGFIERAPNHPSTAEVKAMIAEIDAEMTAHPPVRRPTPPVARLAEPPPTQAPVPAPEARPPTAAPRLDEPAMVVATPPVRSKRAFSKRHLGWIVPLAVGAVAGLSVGIYFGVRGASCDVALGCFDLRR